MHIGARSAFLILIVSMLVTACAAAQQDALLISSAVSTHAKLRPEAASLLGLALEQPSCLGAGCHADPSLTIAVSVHAPYSGGQCSFCHGIDPHGASVNFSPADSIAVCFACHSGALLGQTHRMGVGGTDPRDGSTITCFTCHPAHASDHPHRLNMDSGPALCNQCHSDILPNP